MSFKTIADIPSYLSLVSNSIIPSEEEEKKKEEDDNKSILVRVLKNY